MDKGKKGSARRNGEARAKRKRETSRMEAPKPADVPPGSAPGCETDLSAARRRAEEKQERLNALRARIAPKDGVSSLGAERFLVQELGTYQVQLEMQNEELRRAQAEIEESRSSYVDLYEFAPVGYFTFDKDGLILSANLTGAAMLGVERGALLHRAFGLFVSEEDRDTFYQYLQSLRKVSGGNGRESCEIRLGKGGGAAIYAQIKSSVVTGDDGTVCRIRTTVTDITGRRIAEEALRKERAMLRAVTSATDVLLVYLDPDFNFVWVNSAYAEACRMRPEEMIGRNHFALYPHAENEAIFRRVRDSGQPIFYKDKPFEFPDQPERGVTYWDWSLVPVKDEAGRVTGLVFSLRETTKYKQAVLALAESEQRFRRIAETSGDVIFQIDPRGMITYASPAMRAFGYTPEEVLNNAFPRFLPPGELSKALEALQRVNAGETVSLFEIKVLKSDGSIVDCEVSGSPIVVDGAVIGVQGVARDVTARKLVEKELTSSMRRFSLLAESAGRLLRTTEPQRVVELTCREVMELVGCDVFFNFLADEEGGESRLNAYAGISEEEAREIGSLDYCGGIFSSADREARRIVGGPILSAGEGTGLILPFGIRAYACHPLLSPEGKGIGALFFGSRSRDGFSVDDLSLMKAVADQMSAATERMHHEQALDGAHEELEARIKKRTEQLETVSAALGTERQRFYDVLETLPVYIGLVGPDSEVRFANRMFRDLLGEYQGPCCRFPQFGKGGLFGKTGPRPVLNNGTFQEWEWICPSDRRYEAYRFPFVDADGSMLTLEAGSDITERKQAEDELRSLNLKQELLAARLRALAVELTQVEDRERRRLAELLHDHLQQLLVATRLRLEAAAHEPRANLVRTGLRDAVSILDEAIKASRSLTVELSPPILHTAGLVPGLKWLAQRFAEKNELKVAIHSADIGHSDVEEVRFLLFECVRELLFNVVKHAAVSEATVTLIRCDDDSLKVNVRDEGRGFDPAMLQKRNIHEATFGLFSVEQRLEHIGGKMEIETGLGKGTSVTLTVPVIESSPTAEVVEEAPRGRMKGRGRVCRDPETISVLLVDDHKIMREGLASLLESESDIEVIGEADNGPAAIELAESLQPAVVIMDVNLGEMNGVDATKAILKRNPETKVIGLSMHIDKEVDIAMRKAGASAYLTKGGPLEDLVAAIRKWACRSV